MSDTPDRSLEGEVSATAHSIVAACSRLHDEYDQRFSKTDSPWGGVPMYDDAEEPDLAKVEQQILNGEEPEYDERRYAVDKYDPATLELQDDDTRAEFAAAEEGSFEEWWHTIVTTFEEMVPNWETTVARATYNNHGDQALYLTSSHTLFGDWLAEPHGERKEEQEAQEDVEELFDIGDADDQDGPELFGDVLDVPHESPFDGTDSHVSFAVEYRPGHSVDTTFHVRRAGCEWEVITFDSIKSFNDSSTTIQHAKVDYNLEVLPLADRLADRSSLSPREAEVALLDAYGYQRWTGWSGLVHVNNSTLRSYRSRINTKADDPATDTHFTQEAATRGLTTGFVPSVQCTPLPTDAGEQLLLDAVPLGDRKLDWVPYHDYTATAASVIEFYELSDDTAILRLVDDSGTTYYYTLDRDAVADEYEHIEATATTHGTWQPRTGE